MSDPTQCPNCGADLGSDAPEALCPKCLIENAAWSQTIALPDDPASVPTLLDTSAGGPSQPSHELPPIGADFGGYRIMRLLGKLFRLRLVRSNGTLAGFGRAFSRALLLFLIMSLPFWTSTIINPGWMAGENDVRLSVLMGAVNLLSLAILFCMARRHNGFAGLHGLATDTRVVHALAITKRPVLSMDDSPAADPLEGAEHIGPYHVIEPLGISGSGRWFLAYDTKLLRRVWVHAMDTESPPIPETQRNLNRRGRLRWITGRRTDDENWDAYEAPTGIPFLTLVRNPQSWASVRFWLHDLALELERAANDGTTPPELALDRIWITSDGYAKLLDFPAPGADPSPERLEDPADFLPAVAAAGLVRSPEPIPLSARSLLCSEFRPGIAELAGFLQLAVHRPARVSRRRRFGITLAVSTIPMVVIAFWAFFTFMIHEIKRKNPELMTLSTMTLIIEQFSAGNTREELRRFVAHRHRDLVGDPARWNGWQVDLTITPTGQRIAQMAVRDFPSLTDDEIARAESAARPYLAQEEAGHSAFDSTMNLVLLFSFWITCGAIPAILMALLMRRGLILIIFGVVVANAAGEQVSRGRALWRALLAWSPMLLGVVMAAILVPHLGGLTATVVVLILTLVPIVISHLRPGRTLHDRLAGTWLVPK